MQCKEMCVEIQDQFLKELRDLSEVRGDRVTIAITNGVYEKTVQFWQLLMCI